MDSHLILIKKKALLTFLADAIDSNGWSVNLESQENQIYCFRENGPLIQYVDIFIRPHEFVVYYDLGKGANMNIWSREKIAWLFAQ